MIEAKRSSYSEEFSQPQHHDYSSMVDLMQAVHDRCSEITRLYTIPDDDTFDVPTTTWENRKLYVIEFSKTPGVHVPCK